MKKPFSRKQWIILIVEIIVFAGLLYLYFLGDGIPDRKALLKNSFLQGLAFFLAARLFIRLAEVLIIMVYMRRRKIQRYQKDNFIIGIQQIGSMLTFVAVLLTVSLAFEIDLGSLFTSISIIAAALAILFKDYISNMLNGMILMFSNQISLNDYVKIGSHRGKIIDITLINVHLINDEDDLIYIPNNLIFTTEVVNFTKRVGNKVNFEFEIKHDQLPDVADLEQYLTGQTRDFGDYIMPDSYNLRTVEIKSDAAILNFQYVMQFPNKEVEKDIRKVVARAIIRYCRNPNAPEESAKEVYEQRGQH